MSKSNLQNVLQDLIAEEVQLFFNKNKGTILLEEPENQEKNQLHSVLIKGITTCYLAVKLDHSDYKFLGKLFTETKGIRKAVDAVIICTIKARDYILLIEMKSKTTLEDKQDIAKKVKNAQAFISFLHLLLTHHYKLEKHINNFKVINILFDRKVNKGNVSTVTVSTANVSYKHRGFGRADNEVFIQPFLR